jgi:hypothetical protein
MTKWLKERNVESVAMESTGVYWIAPHEVLEAEGLEVLLVVNGGEKLGQNGGEWRRTGPCPLCALSLLIGVLCLERPVAVKGAPLLGAAKRTLDGEDRSERIESEGKGRRKVVPPKWPRRSPPLTAGRHPAVGTSTWT